MASSTEAAARRAAMSMDLPDRTAAASAETASAVPLSSMAPTHLSPSIQNAASFGFKSPIVMISSPV